MKCHTIPSSYPRLQAGEVVPSPVLRLAHRFICAISLTLALTIILDSALPACAAVLDFTPLSGETISASYNPGTGRVEMSFNGANPNSVQTGETSDIKVANGVVAWSSTTRVYMSLFDPVRNQWVNQSVPLSGAPQPQDLSSADGVVAWSTGGSAPLTTSFWIYDPARGLWIGGNGAGPVRENVLLNTNGVVAWSTLTGVNFVVYDPTRITNPGNGWKAGSVAFPANTTGTGDLQNNNGVVAWSINPFSGPSLPRVTYTVYDPTRGEWRPPGFDQAGQTSNLRVENAQVKWTGGDNVERFRGYNPGSGTWANGLPVPQAWFAVSTNSGNAPVRVMFIDMSLAGTAWSWDFGDGSSSPRRSTFHSYGTFGRFNARQTANRFSVSSVTNRVILTDIVNPSGTVAINGADTFTTNRNVTLTLTASDNSGAVIAMRFSNDGTTWNAWETFATTKAWSLSASNGNKTVSAQFHDNATNLSAIVTDTIALDTTPPPTISLATTNLDESTGNVTLRVRLSTTYSQPVTFSYATSNGTAIAGSDYNQKSGSLVIPANATGIDLPLSGFIINDGATELNETIFLRFFNVTNAVAGPPGVINIIDDDPPSVSFASTEFTTIESNLVGVASVRLNAPSGLTVFVSYHATNGTATAGIDFIPVEGLLTFAPGITEQLIRIDITNDNVSELSESVNIVLFNPTNASLALPDQASLIIIDDDKPLVSFTQGSYTAYETTNINNQARASVRLSKAFVTEVNVEVNVSALTATPGEDYDQPPTSIALRFLPGQTNKDISITIRNNSTPEPFERIRLTLTEFFDVSPGQFTQADIVIIDDDAPPAMLNSTLSNNGLFQTDFVGYPGQRFDVEYSINLSNWFRLVTLTNTTGTLSFSQPIPTNSPPRFYRTRLL